jgi:hypothetical protein
MGSDPFINKSWSAELGQTPFSNVRHHICLPGRRGAALSTFLLRGPTVLSRASTAIPSDRDGSLIRAATPMASDRDGSLIRAFAPMASDRDGSLRYALFPVRSHRSESAQAIWPREAAGDRSRTLADYASVFARAGSGTACPRLPWLLPVGRE